ncbi:MAG: DUF4974 domain-containing protein [Porphyromonadaceae bacterium]|nr:DUF4974 domain-containing protein [Porphyromonadaceae bacterium]
MENRKSRIIRTYLSSRFSNETEEKVQRWIIKNSNANKTEQSSYEYWKDLNVEPDQMVYDTLKRVNSRIGYVNSQRVIPIYKKFLRVAAALVLLIMLLGGYLYYTSDNNNWTKISVAYGEEKHLYLPDSSEIWINSGTTIKYPKKFEGNLRAVYLDGEAYFSVKRNPKKPFVVRTERINVKVLGTKFNVKAYTGDENTVTTLTSGKVEVNTLTNQVAILKPNEQLILNNKTSQKNIKRVSVEETTAWMSGQMIFTNTSLDEILQTLERKFDVAFIIDKLESLSNKNCTVKFLKNDSLEDILNILQEVINGFSYKIEKNKVFISIDN